MLIGLPFGSSIVAITISLEEGHLKGASTRLLVFDPARYALLRACHSAISCRVGRSLCRGQAGRDLRAAEEHLVEVRFKRIESRRESGAAWRRDARTVEHLEERGHVYTA